MHQVPLKDAQHCLEDLIIEATKGQKVIITKDDGIGVQLVPVSTPLLHPRFGSAKGRIKMAEDFDAPLEDFEDYAP